MCCTCLGLLATFFFSVRAAAAKGNTVKFGAGFMMDERNGYIDGQAVLTSGRNPFNQKIAVGPQ